MSDQPQPAAGTATRKVTTDQSRLAVKAYYFGTGNPWRTASEVAAAMGVERPVVARAFFGCPDFERRWDPAYLHKQYQYRLRA